MSIRNHKLLPTQLLLIISLVFQSCNNTDTLQQSTVQQNSEKVEKTETPTATSTPIFTQTPTGSPKIYLSTLTPEFASVGHEKLLIGRYNNLVGGTLDFIKDNQAYPYGLMSHAPAKIDYLLEYKYQKFHSGLFLGPCGGDGAIFQIKVDGKEVYTSEIITSEDDMVDVEVDVTGAEWLTLIVLPGNSGNCDWAIWADPYLEQNSGGGTNQPVNETIKIVNQDGNTEFTQDDSLQVQFLDSNIDREALTYIWYRNEIRFMETREPNISNESMKTFTGIEEEKTPKSNHTDHAIRGYSYKVKVMDSNENLIGSDEIIIGGSAFGNSKIRAVHFSNEFASDVESPQALGSMDFLFRRVDMNWAVVDSQYYVENVNSTEIIEVYEENDVLASTSSLEAIASMIKHAHNQGIGVIYNPQIMALSGEDRESMKTTPEWFSSYEKFIVEQAEFAEENNVEVFSVGCELRSMGPFEEEWRKIIDTVKQVYSGKITYFTNTNYTPEGRNGINWDIEWWDAVDIIGANFHIGENFNFSNNDPSLSEIKDQIKPYVEKLREIGSEHQKPVLISEVAAYGFDGSWNVPTQNYVNTMADKEWVYCLDKDIQPDFQEQADIAQAVMELVYPVDEIIGLVWLQWEVTNEGWNYTMPFWHCGCEFVYRPMERTIQSWYKQD